MTPPLSTLGHFETKTRLLLFNTVLQTRDVPCVCPVDGYLISQGLDGTSIGAVTADEALTQPVSVAAKEESEGLDDEPFSAEVDGSSAPAPVQTDEPLADTQGISLAADSDGMPAADMLDGAVAEASVRTGTTTAEDVALGEDLPSITASASEIAAQDPASESAEEVPLPVVVVEVGDESAALAAEDVVSATTEKVPQAPGVATAVEARAGCNNVPPAATSEDGPTATPVALSPEQPLVDTAGDVSADPVSEAATLAVAEVDAPGVATTVDILTESTISSSAEKGGVVDVVALDASVSDDVVDADQKPMQPGSVVAAMVASLDDDPLLVLGGEVPAPVQDGASSSVAAETPAMGDVPVNEVAPTGAPGCVEDDAAAAVPKIEEVGVGDGPPQYEEVVTADCGGGKEGSEAANDVPMDEEVVRIDPAVPKTEVEVSSPVAAAVAEKPEEEVDDVPHAAEPTESPTCTADNTAAAGAVEEMSAATVATPVAVGSVAAVVAGLEDERSSALDEEASPPGLDESLPPAVADKSAAASSVRVPAVKTSPATETASEDTPAPFTVAIAAPAAPAVLEPTSAVVEEVLEVERKGAMNTMSAVEEGVPEAERLGQTAATAVEEAGIKAAVEVSCH